MEYLFHSNVHRTNGWKDDHNSRFILTLFSIFKNWYKHKKNLHNRNDPAADDQQCVFLLSSASWKLKCLHMHWKSKEVPQSAFTFPPCHNQEAVALVTMQASLSQTLLDSVSALRENRLTKPSGCDWSILQQIILKANSR